MKKLFLTISLLLIAPAALAADDQAVAIAQLTAKVSQLEEQNRTLTGRLEELEHQMNQLQSAAIAAQSRPPVHMPAPETAPVLGQQAAEVTTATGAAVTKPNQYVTKIEQPAEDDDAIEQEFDVVFKSVAAEDYKTAKPALRAFIEKHPGTELSGEAYFWLGEIAWSERDFNTAAINYLKGYKEAPTGEKAPENILKMALTLKELGKKDEACKYIARFATEFPDAHKDLQNRALSAKADLGCK